MSDHIHDELKTLLGFFLKQIAARPTVFTCAPGLIARPEFFSVGKLQDYLNNPLLNPDWIDLRFNNDPVPLQDAMLGKMAQRKQLMFMDKRIIHECLERGGAVVLEGIDILDAGINAFVAQVDQALPCTFANCVAFFSQKENEAYGGHRDSDDVLVVQISGEKRWRIFEPQQRRYLNNSPLTVEQLGRQAAEVVMKAGDALYVRAGVPHICQTTGNHSLHLAFDLCDRTPDIEQITAEANLRYNNACEEPYVPASKVVDRYLTLLGSDAFRKDISNATRQVRQEAMEFRKCMSRTSAISALSKYIH